jgi:uncharacterized protein YjbI with pentapeptide repeats
MRLHRPTSLKAAALALVIAAIGPGGLAAADLTAREVTETLFKARGGGPVDFAGRSLEGLDLSGLDFAAARLVRSDLFGTDLTRTRLAGADLTGARLDRATVTRTDFTGARLNGAMLRSLTVFLGVEPDPADAPRFTAADLSSARIVARLDGADFRGARLIETELGPQPAIWGSYTPRAMLIGADFSAAELRRTDLRNAVLHFARFVNATLVDVDLRGADLSGADFSGAELRGVDLTGADLDGTVFRGARGLDQAIGLDRAKNLERTIR